MKKPVFKYFDEFCYSELIGEDEDPKWLRPIISYHGFGYDGRKNIIFYNNELEESITSTFGVDINEFKNLLKEWFEDRYKLKVLDVM